MATKDFVQTYARALFDMAVAADAVDEVDDGIATISDAVRSHAGLLATLSDMFIPASKKREIMREVFEAKAAGEAVAMATVMAERGHASRIDNVARTYREIAERERGIVVAEVTTAVALTESSRASIIEKLTGLLEHPVTLRERIDSSILGGIVINVGGRVLDGSLSSQLDGVRTALSSTPQGGEA
jgi:F-type H+-transporting ATPase subunit delta